VLDVGIGELLLRDHLLPYCYALLAYGMICRSAHRAGRAPAGREHHHSPPRIRDLRPLPAFRLLGINECVYYFNAPVVSVRRYDRFSYRRLHFVVSTSAPLGRRYRAAARGSNIHSFRIGDHQPQSTWGCGISTFNLQTGGTAGLQRMPRPGFRRPAAPYSCFRRINGDPGNLSREAAFR